MARCVLFVPVLCLAIWINAHHVGCIIPGAAVRYTVTMKMYSGREDPNWEIDSNTANFDQLSWALTNARSTDLSNGLGYCGYQVVAEDAFGNRVWKTVGRGDSRKLELLLADSCGGRLSKTALNHMKSSVYGHVSSHKRQHVVVHTVVINEDKKRKKRQAAVCRRPSFNPAFWNVRSVRRNNNCYNYATNIRTDTFAQPGRASGRRYTRTTVPNVRAAAIRDGLVRLNPGAISSTGYCVIALVIWEGEDYHFLRLDNSGYWSQKSGQTRARNTDEGDNVIIDPRTADRGPYTQFGGFLGVAPSVDIV